MQHQNFVKSKMLFYFFYFFINLLLLTSCLSPQYSKNHCLGCHRSHYKGIGDCYYCHQGVSLSNNVNIAHKNLIPKKFSYFRFKKHPVIAKGKRIVWELGCRRCHRIEGKGNLLASNIDNIVVPFDVKDIVNAINYPAFYMPRFALSKKQVEEVVNYILSSATNHKNKGSFSYKIHFQGFRENIFDAKCGKCHKILTKKAGGLGKGDIGPNLSGLFTIYYPEKSFIYSCSVKKLKAWLKNPRELKPFTIMPAPYLSDFDIEKLINILKD